MLVETRKSGHGEATMTITKLVAGAAGIGAALGGAALGGAALGGGDMGSPPLAAPAPAAAETAGNPVFAGWYADPEVAVFGGRFWIYPTYSARYDEQVFFDAFSSEDLVHWTKHEKVLTAADVKWARRAMWAPSVVEKDGKYFFFFGANDIQSDAERGGIGVAVSDEPGGPFVDYLGGPLVDAFHNGAQPIDQFVFRDGDGRDYLIYGGWRHCNIARLAEDYRSLEPFEDGTVYREITPEGYVEGPFMFVRDGKYYFMWSEGGWTGPNYSVAYAVAVSPMGPFERIGKILQQDPAVATGAGHHSVLKIPGRDEWYIVYHRRPLGETDGNHRVVCIDRLEFDAEGKIEPVKITREGVGPVD
jgi:beta-xylosidase